jgi:hypothetical protein
MFPLHTQSVKREVGRAKSGQKTSTKTADHLGYSIKKGEEGCANTTGDESTVCRRLPSS